ncbi:MAG TPA: gliding motility-associated C-terminal domain-containing protein, partial [Chitinophagaceae bacterium]|nr:gliding motility-associated C-terminal domain-containing protein [Chitinophagaceae bacterium]
VFNLTPTTALDDIFISKLDANGNFVWAKQLKGALFEGGYAITVDGSGNVYTTGFFAGTVDFDPGLGTFNMVSVNNSDIYISKLDANGNFVWAKQLSGSSQSLSESIALDNSGNIFLTGYFRNSIDVDPGTATFNMTAAGELDAFLVKLDNNGNFVWAKQFGGSGVDRGHELSLDASGNIYLIGDFENTVDFDSGPAVLNFTSAGNTDIFISKFDNNGNLIWAKQIGGPDHDIGYSVKPDAMGNVYSTGFFNQTVDFDPAFPVYNLSSPGGNDAYVLKLGHCLNSTAANLNVVSCSSYTLNGQTYTLNGTYTQVLTNVAGCDSIITLNLSIGSSTYTTAAVACDSYTWEGQTYTNNGFYSVRLIDANGCDSIRNLNLIIKKKVFSTINASVCEGQQYEGYNVSGNYTDIYTAANGCDSIRTLQLIVKPKLSSTVNATICEGQQYEGYNVSGSYTNIYTAANGCDSIRTLQLTVKLKSNSTIRAAICEGEQYEGYNVSGSYANIYTAANGCDSIRTLNLFVNPRKFTSLNVKVCQGQSYYAGGDTQTISGTYKDTLSGYLGCDSIITTNLTVASIPKPYLGSDRNLCSGTSITLNPGTFSSYSWQNMSNMQSFIADTAGIYWVTVKDNNNCSATDTIEIKNILPVPFDFLKQADSICQYEKLRIESSNSYSSYQWSTGSAQSFTTVDKPGTYTLKVQDTNGCIGRDTVQVYQKYCNHGFFVPSAFTPNNDGKNDVFRPLLFGNVIKYKFTIYNRWGQKVFETTDLQKSWNGNFNGIPQSAFVFIWECFYQLEGGNPSFQKGTVTLIR